jgi:hypothetical protein
MGFGKMRIADYRYEYRNPRPIDEDEIKALKSSVRKHGLLNLTKDTAIFAIVDRNAIDANQLVPAGMVSSNLHDVVFWNTPTKVEIVQGLHRMEIARRVLGSEAEWCFEFLDAGEQRT